MQHLEVSCAVRHFFNSLGFKGLTETAICPDMQKIRIIGFLNALQLPTDALIY